MSNGGYMKIKISHMYEYLLSIERKDEISNLIKNIRCFDEYYKPQYLSEYVWNLIFSESFDRKELEDVISILTKHKYEIEEEILDSISKCYQKLKTKKIYVFIFPIVRNEITKVYFKFMGGIAASCPYKSILLLFINPTTINWRNFMRVAVFHEYTHCIRLNYFNPYLEEPTLLEYIIREGIGDVFVYRNLGVKPIWVIYSQKKAKEFYKLIIKNKDSKNRALILKIMFGDGRKIPKWVGYAVGFNIVKSVMEENNLSFEKIIKMNASEIFNKYLTKRVRPSVNFI